jgi:hypothetical protein
MAQFDLYTINSVIIPKDTPQAEIDKIIGQSPKYCPLIKATCLGFQCAWFELGDKAKYRLEDPEKIKVFCAWFELGDKAKYRLEDPEKIKVFFGHCMTFNIGQSA